MFRFVFCIPTQSLIFWSVRHGRKKKKREKQWAGGVISQAAGTRFTRAQSKKQWLGRTFAETQSWTHFAPRNVRIVGPNAFAPHNVQ